MTRPRAAARSIAEGQERSPFRVLTSPIRDHRVVDVDKAKYLARRGLHAVGLDVHRTHGSLGGVRQRLSARNGVTVVFDVGANRGQYGWELRAAGYQGRICSFEPLETAYRVLRERSVKDPAWDCWQLALSDRAGEARMNVSANSVSSSLLPMAATHLAADPASRNVAEEQVALRTLDDVVEELRLPPEDRFGLKIDTQGHEWEVFDGAASTLPRCAWVEVELSLVELYTGQRLFLELLERLKDQRFEMTQIESVFSDPETGQLLQVNGLFRAPDACV